MSQCLPTTLPSLNTTSAGPQAAKSSRGDRKPIVLPKPRHLLGGAQRLSTGVTRTKAPAVLPKPKHLASRLSFRARNGFARRSTARRQSGRKRKPEVGGKRETCGEREPSVGSAASAERRSEIASIPRGNVASCIHSLLSITDRRDPQHPVRIQKEQAMLCCYQKCEVSPTGYGHGPPAAEPAADASVEASRGDDVLLPVDAEELSVGETNSADVTPVPKPRRKLCAPAQKGTADDAKSWDLYGEILAEMTCDGKVDDGKRDGMSLAVGKSEEFREVVSGDVKIACLPSRESERVDLFHDDHITEAPIPDEPPDDSPALPPACEDGSSVDSTYHSVTVVNVDYDDVTSFSSALGLTADDDNDDGSALSAIPPTDDSVVSPPTHTNVAAVGYYPGYVDDHYETVGTHDGLQPTSESDSDNVDYCDIDEGFDTTASQHMTRNPDSDDDDIYIDIEDTSDRKASSRPGDDAYRPWASLYTTSTTNTDPIETDPVYSDIADATPLSMAFSLDHLADYGMDCGERTTRRGGAKRKNFSDPGFRDLNMVIRGTLVEIREERREDECDIGPVDKCDNSDDNRSKPPRRTRPVRNNRRHSCPIPVSHSGPVLLQIYDSDTENDWQQCGQHFPDDLTELSENEPATYDPYTPGVGHGDPAHVNRVAMCQPVGALVVAPQRATWYCDIDIDNHNHHVALRAQAMKHSKSEQHLEILGMPRSGMRQRAKSSVNLWEKDDDKTKSKKSLGDRFRTLFKNKEKLNATNRDNQYASRNTGSATKQQVDDVSYCSTNIISAPMPLYIPQFGTQPPQRPPPSLAPTTRLANILQSDEALGKFKVHLRTDEAAVAPTPAFACKPELLPRKPIVKPPLPLPRKPLRPQLAECGPRTESPDNNIVMPIITADDSDIRISYCNISHCGKKGPTTERGYSLTNEALLGGSRRSSFDAGRVWKRKTSEDVLAQRAVELYESSERYCRLPYVNVRHDVTNDASKTTTQKALPPPLPRRNNNMRPSASESQLNAKVQSLTNAVTDVTVVDEMTTRAPPPLPKRNIMTIPINSNLVVCTTPSPKTNDGSSCQPKRQGSSASASSCDSANLSVSRASSNTSSSSDARSRLSLPRTESQNSGSSADSAVGMTTGTPPLYIVSNSSVENWHSSMQQAKSLGSLCDGNEERERGNHPRSHGDLPSCEPISQMINVDQKTYPDHGRATRPRAQRRSDSIGSRSASESSVQRDSPTATNLSSSSSTRLSSAAEKTYTSEDEDLSDDDDYISARGIRKENRDSRFHCEPLYQYYHEDTRRRNSSGDEDDIYETYGCSPAHDDSDLVEEVFEEAVASYTSVREEDTSIKIQRSLWCELPEVKKSGLLNLISDKELKLQESMFEVIASEASYLRSLNILINNFLLAPEFELKSASCVVTSSDKHHLFSNIVAVRDVSEKVMNDLENRWKENLLISEISDIIARHASSSFDVYIKYCSNTTYQERTLSNLKKSNPSFLEALRRLESVPESEGLSMHSFMLLPMQRITRLPLLLEAVKSRVDTDSAKFKTICKTLVELKKIVSACNEGSRKMDRMEQLCHISSQLDFKIKKLPLVSSSRWLVKKGDVTRIIPAAAAKLTFGMRRQLTQTITLFLFNDVLLVAKKKGEGNYMVIDSAWRTFLEARHIEDLDSYARLPKGVPSSCKYVIELVMFENHAGKHDEMIISFNSENECMRWMDVLNTEHQQANGEKIYELWDCPQVQIVHKYVAQQPDELSLEVKDVVNVTRKLHDGWYEGEKLSDGERGWFPANHVEEMVNSHVRAKNLRSRHRLLTETHAYVEKQLKGREVGGRIKQQPVANFVL
ncbi:PREDICTED: uncharacterized protein LOC106809650 [Priapulus caudatus]|uniref:Uncharacterized protein LOC106809650 n=1 Tax=Priapulus caudatus TaxID=37621 RepID=A0ABM1E7Y0_PRICU|nr:PREDICTED: uncharacterized protein LOC106809650 [Priapulus caudatus]XP_014668302.1 PREDICTED: uncharacterized protein LOC106809650 [Priapulus caudatus]